jgi:hypothetical protein
MHGCRKFMKFSIVFSRSQCSAHIDRFVDFTIIQWPSSHFWYSFVEIAHSLCKAPGSVRVFLLYPLITPHATIFSSFCQFWFSSSLVLPILVPFGDTSLPILVPFNNGTRLRAKRIITNQSLNAWQFRRSNEDFLSFGESFLHPGTSWEIPDTSLSNSNTSRYWSDI